MAVNLIAGFLAVIDASTLGEFRMYAIPWQMSPGCQAAGFIGVLSSELSVYTLTVITLERNYAITHAMHLNKRLSLRHAAYVMLGGWLFAATMAGLPIVGVSDYRKFAVCLPFETAGAGLVYVVSLMTINGLAFLILMICYMKIYCSIRGSQAWNSNDSKIAKRMALLVFTDFVCLAPIAFFSLTAAFGLHLATLEEAKVFTVFVLPFNSCCNPFLYALLTKQFKKDCVMMCKSIEESRVTRGIGRCRHSSNFSNRQTPANTNSAVEQTSKSNGDDCNCHGNKQVPLTLRQRLRISFLKFAYCHHRNKKANNDIEQNKNGNKILKNASLSRYSSPNWKRGHISLQILDRQRRTWYLTRKPSQESNLSSSRNDSSATTASTSTWRISRSSVSSDVSSGASKAMGKTDSLRLCSFKERRSDSRNSNVMVMQHTPCHADSFKKSKPKLQRQTAIVKETFLSNKLNSDALQSAIPNTKNDLSCVYEQESVDEEDSEQKQSVQSPTYRLSGLIIGFIPRKLSTISSHSTSVNKDGEELSSPDHQICTVDPDTNTEEIIYDDPACYPEQQPGHWSSHRLPLYKYSRCPSDGDICRQSGTPRGSMSRTTTLPEMATTPVKDVASPVSSHNISSAPYSDASVTINSRNRLPDFTSQIKSPMLIDVPLASQMAGDCSKPSVSIASKARGTQSFVSSPPYLAVRGTDCVTEHLPYGMLETHFPVDEPPDEGHPLL